MNNGEVAVYEELDDDHKAVQCFTEPEESVVLRSQTVVKDGHVSAEKAGADVLPFDMFQEA